MSDREFGFGLNTDTHEGRIETLVADAYDSDTNETQRWRPDGGNIEEVRLREKPLFGIHLEVDIRLTEEQSERVVPGDIQNSVIEEEMAAAIDPKNDVTRLEEALDAATYDWLVCELAAAKDTDEEAVKETLDDMGLCSELYSTGDHHVAVFFAYI